MGRGGCKLSCTLQKKVCVWSGDFFAMLKRGGGAETGFDVLLLLAINVLVTCCFDVRPISH